MSDSSNDHERHLAFLSALAALQVELEGVTKDARNPHFKSQYADRTSILLFLRPLLHKHGFVLTQALTVPPPHITGNVLAMVTTLHHVATGVSIGDTAIVPLPKSDPQGYGSAATYTSRYSIVNLLALPLLEDDDGNAASPTLAKVTPNPTKLPTRPATKPDKTDDTSDNKSDERPKTRTLWGAK